MSSLPRKMFDSRALAAFSQLLEVKIQPSYSDIPNTKINVAPTERYISIYPDITVIIRSFPDAPFVAVDIL